MPLFSAKYVGDAPCDPMQGVQKRASTESLMGLGELQPKAHIGPQQETQGRGQRSPGHSGSLLRRFSGFLLVTGEAKLGAAFHGAK